MATRTGNLRSPAVKIVVKSPNSCEMWCRLGTFTSEIPTTAKPNHRLNPSSPRNFLSPPSAPVQGRLQGPPAKSKFLAVKFLAVTLLAIAPDAPGEENASFDAAIHFGDTVLMHGLDTYGENHTPLIVDALNVDTLEPPERIQSWTGGEGLQPWISSNLADQGNLQRFMTGLSALTHNPRYANAMKAAIQYNFDHYQNESGLLPLGHHRFIELKRDAYHGDIGKGGCPHEMKMNFLYFPIFFDVNAEATSRMLQGIWNSHIRNWENLDFNRHAGYGKKLEHDVWDHEYPEDFMGIPEGALSFYDTACDMIVAAGNLTLHTGDKRPLQWAERLLRRYTSNAHPVTKLPPYQHTQSGDRAAKQNFPDNVKEYSFLAAYSEGSIRPPDTMFAYGATALLRLGESLDDQGTFIIRSVHEGMAAWAKHAYHPEDNTLHPLACDGTDLTGYVIEKDGYFGKKGRVLKPWKAHPGYLLAYALCYRLTGDEAIWTTLRHMLKGNEIGNIGETSDATPQLHLDTKQDDPEIIFALIELYKITKNKHYLALSDVIAKNILKNRYLADNGLFVLDERLIVANLNTLEPLALITLEAAKTDRLDEVPTYDASGKFAWGRIAVLSGHSQPVPTLTDMRLFRPEEGAVTRWLDKSGHNNHAHIPKNSSVEYLKNGIGDKSALRLSKGSGFEIAATESLALKQMSLFIVWQSEGAQKHEATFFGQRPANKSFQLGLYGGSQLYFSNVTKEEYRRINTTLKEGKGSPELITATANGKLLSLFVNGKHMGDAPAPGDMFNQAEALVVGNGGHYAFNGLISEILLYDRAVSKKEQTKIESYLGNKYGLGSTKKSDSAPDIKGCVLWLDAEDSVKCYREP